MPYWPQKRLQGILGAYRGILVNIATILRNFKNNHRLLRVKLTNLNDCLSLLKVYDKAMMEAISKGIKFDESDNNTRNDLVELIKELREYMAEYSTPIFSKSDNINIATT